MNYHRNRKNRRLSRSARIEKKCDRILSELKILKSFRNTRNEEIDDVIERMHRNAREMRRRAYQDSLYLRNMFHS